MREIQLIVGEKGAGKSTRIEWEYKRLAPLCNAIEIVNPDDFNTIIYVLEDKKTKSIIVLNSGSDMKCIIERFGNIIKKYPIADKVYTAIRPLESNRNLHIWMMRELNITSSDIRLPDICLP